MGIALKHPSLLTQALRRNQTQKLAKQWILETRMQPLPISSQGGSLANILSSQNIFVD